MSTLTKFIRNRNHFSNSLSFLHTSAIKSTPSPSRHHTPTRRDPNTSHYDDLVSEAGESRDFPRLRQLLLERLKNKASNTRDTFNFITNTESSLAILDDVFNCLATLPEGAPRKSAFNSLVQRLCILGLTYDALMVLDEMHDRNIEVNSHSYDPLIQTLIKRMQIDKALEVLLRMKKVGINPDVTLYNYILTWYCMKGDVSHAVYILEKMVRGDGVNGDSRTYDAMVIGACKARKVEAAVMVMRAAIDDGVKVMNCTYLHVIKALIRQGFYEQAIEFVMWFAGRNKILDDENFDFLANGLIYGKKFEEAEMVVDEMSKRRLSMSDKVREFHLKHGSSSVIPCCLNSLLNIRHRRILN